MVKWPRGQLAKRQHAPGGMYVHSYGGRVLSCAFCGADMIVGREDHPYREAGLGGLTLVDIEVSRCSRCRYYRLGVKEPESLNRAIAEFMIARPRRLTGSQVRYLRRCLSLSETELARRLGVTIGSVSRWEHGAREINGSAERLLRLLVALELEGAVPPLGWVGREPAAELVGRVVWNGTRSELTA